MTQSSIADASSVDVTFAAAALIQQLRAGSLVADCGCFGWLLAEPCRAAGHRLVGLDRVEPPGRPAGADYARMVDHQIELEDDSVDLVVASHVLEHMVNPMEFFASLVRITRPGGLIWIEAPSELSAMLPSSDIADDHSFVSFWDDPTHIRPWTPGALYRLALSRRCRPISIQRAELGALPVVRMLAMKPLDLTGQPPNSYVMLKEVPPGIDQAWKKFW